MLGYSDSDLPRRRYLAAIGAVSAGLIAGCSGTDGGDATDTDSSSESGSTTTSGSASGGNITATTDSTTEPETTGASKATETTVSSTETKTSVEPTSVLEILSTEIVDKGFDIGVISKIKNIGKRRLARVEAKMTFRNEAGEMLGSIPTTISVSGLEPGHIWEVYVPYLEETKLAEGDLSLETATVGAVPEPLENVELLEHHLKPPSEKYVGPNVVGKAKNTGDSSIEFLEATATFIGKNGNVLSSGYTMTRDLSAGKTWNFNVDFRGYTAEFTEKTGDYKLYLTDVPP